MKIIFVSAKSGFDLSSISFFQRGTAQDFITFTAKVMVTTLAFTFLLTTLTTGWQVLVERTALGSRQSVKEAEYMVHVFVRGDSLAAVAVSDHEYPPRVAHTMLTRLLEDFAGRQLNKYIR